LTQTRLNIITLGIMLSLFLASMEGTVVATAMPSIVAQLGGLSIYSWVFSVYLLTSTTTVPIYGKLSDLYGRKLVYAVSMLLFLFGSLLCAQAHNMEQLIIFRAIQGLGAGGVLPLAFTIIGEIFTLEQRAKMQGVFSGVWGVSAVIGPLIGGFLVDQISWHWIFYINVFPGAIAISLVAIAWQDRVHKGAARLPIDYPGAILLTLGALALLLGLNEPNTLFGWLCMAMAAGLFAGLIWAESRAVDPILPLHLFRERLFNVSVMHGFLSGWAMFGSLNYVPLFVQAVLGTSATQAGITLTPMSVMWTVASIFGGRLLLKMGYRTLALIGMAVMVSGTFFMSRIGVNSSQIAVMAYTGAMGVGMGLSVPAFLIAVQSTVEKYDLGVATSTLQFSRNIGAAIGVSILGTSLTAKLASHLIAAGIDPASISLDNLLIPVSDTSTIIIGPLRQALAISIANIFIIAFVAALAGLLVVTLAPAGMISQLMRERTMKQSPSNKPFQTPNPWLEIPAGDYEGHMGSPEVGQLSMLNQLFKRILEETRPEALAILGCTTGNGFEHIDSNVTKTILGVDINPDYLQIAGARFENFRERLELKCADIQSDCFDGRQFDLIHGALVFEYVEPGIVLGHIHKALAPDGTFSAVLQLPHAELPSVSKTSYTSLEKLAPIMHHYEQAQFIALANQQGLRESKGEIINLPSGKTFYFGQFKKSVP
jgi:EmrB/QacA subfamily drug resistance transporter